MQKSSNLNIEMLEVAVERLGILIDDMVFLGGCATGLLLTDPAAPPTRITRDVDVMVEVSTLAGYHHFNEKLRRPGFSEDSSPEATICRWQSGRIILDVMPTDPELLGFGNQWFARAFPTAHYLSLPSGTKIRMLPAPYFLATKIEAFHHRGAGDFLLSKDVEEVKNAENDLMKYLAGQLSQWLGNPDFMDALPGLLPPDAASQARVSKIIERIQKISER